jgi:hypothetical protein
MAVKTTIELNSLCAKYAADCTHGALTTTAPTSTSGTEVSGGSPAYARKPISWPGATAGVMTATALVFDVPASTTVVGYENFDALTAGNYRDGASITSQTFASQGTYTVTPTYTQT